MPRENSVSQIGFGCVSKTLDVPNDMQNNESMQTPGFINIVPVARLLQLQQQPAANS